jgi:signal transduction histidine kinase
MILKNTWTLATFAVDKEEELIEENRQVLRAMASYMLRRVQSAAECRDFLRRYVEYSDRFVNMGIVGPEGSVLCSAAPLRNPVNISNCAWFREVLTKREFVVGAYEGHGCVADIPVLIFAYPVMTPDRMIIRAIVFAAVDLKWLHKFNMTIESRMHGDYSLAMVDRNGLVLSYTPDSPNRVGQPLDNPVLYAAARAQIRGVFKTAGAGGAPYLYALAPGHGGSADQPFSIILGVPQSVAFAASNRILRLNLLFFGVVTIMVLAAAWFGGELLLLRPVGAIVRTARKLTAGSLETRTGLQHGKGELGLLAEAFDKMADSLEKRENDHRLAEAELRKSQEQLRNLSEHLQAVREEERIWVAREIHDDLGQALTALRMDLSWLKKRLPADETSLQKRADSMSKTIDATMETVHRISSELRPKMLDDLGLAVAMEWLVEDFQNRTGIPCELIIESQAASLDKGQSTALFRIFQETLTNIARHANAAGVEVNLDLKPEETTLEVKDDGRGITREELASPKAYGIIGIRERVRALGGEAIITGEPGRGTTVKVRIPACVQEERHG